MQSSDLHYAAQAWVLAGGNLLTFAHLIKLPGLAGEVITMWLRGRTPVRQPLRSTHACRQFLLGSDYESLIGVRPGLARASAARPLAGSSPSAADGRLAALKGDQLSLQPYSVSARPGRIARALRSKLRSSSFETSRPASSPVNQSVGTRYRYATIIM